MLAALVLWEWSRIPSSLDAGAATAARCAVASAASVLLMISAQALRGSRLALAATITVFAAMAVLSVWVGGAADAGVWFSLMSAAGASVREPVALTAAAWLAATLAFALSLHPQRRGFRQSAVVVALAAVIAATAVVAIHAVASDAHARLHVMAAAALASYALAIVASAG
ncbi:MAG: hypothetical protein NW204_01365, partial [Xanthomonadaceae bacterium]|nr:hypothetical protein [Xanthomonadaceae bacterium]